ncbi:MAG: hypothetical protein K0R49_1095 [Burkholderiales bacterium]|jgi:hypothetical protein|nr:hypothetical protein [Burkholderiales bacterium]
MISNRNRVFTVTNKNSILNNIVKKGASQGYLFYLFSVLALIFHMNIAQALENEMFSTLVPDTFHPQQKYLIRWIIYKDTIYTSFGVGDNHSIKGNSLKNMHGSNPDSSYKDWDITITKGCCGGTTASIIVTGSLNEILISSSKLSIKKEPFDIDKARQVVRHFNGDETVKANPIGLVIIGPNGQQLDIEDCDEGNEETALLGKNKKCIIS